MAEIKNASLLFKDKNGNIGRISSLTEDDIAKIQLARDHVAKIVDRQSGELIQATTEALGVVKLASDTDVTNGTSGKVVDAAQLAAVKSDLSKVYKYKGSVASYDKLPTTDVQNGDVYNVEAANGNFPAGTNYAAIIGEGGAISWDALGGSIDTSDFALKSGDNTFTGTNTVIDLTDTSADGQIANKKYVDTASQIVTYSATTPVDADVANNRVVFFPSTDLLQ